MSRYYSYQKQQRRKKRSRQTAKSKKNVKATSRFQGVGMYVGFFVVVFVFSFWWVVRAGGADPVEKKEGLPPEVAAELEGEILGGQVLGVQSSTETDDDLSLGSQDSQVNQEGSIVDEGYASLTEQTGSTGVFPEIEPLEDSGDSQEVEIATPSLSRDYQIDYGNFWYHPDNLEEAQYLMQPLGCLQRPIDRVRSDFDKDGDGIDDQTDIYLAALEQTRLKIVSTNKYYDNNEGKPPTYEGSAPDIFWRSLSGAGYDFQELLYFDMQENTSEYPLYIWNMRYPSKSIDFRRVPNIEAYLQRHGQKLSTNIRDCKIDSLYHWQAGDIVIYQLSGEISNFIGIVSAKRNHNGVPYVIYYGEEKVVEADELESLGHISGHYRWEVI